MSVGFRRVTPEREGEETLFFLGSTSVGHGVFGVKSMRVVLRRKVFECPKTGSSKQWC